MPAPRLGAQPFTQKHGPKTHKHTDIHEREIFENQQEFTNKKSPLFLSLVEREIASGEGSLLGCEPAALP